MGRFLRGILTLLATAMLLLIPAGAAMAQPADKDCADFGNQGEAQAYFDDNGGSPDNNFNRLDSDGDGVVCEDLPAGEAPAEQPAEQPAEEPAEEPVVQEPAEAQPAPEAAEQPAAAEEAEEPGQLPFTGASSPALLGAGGLLILGGLMVVAVFRYRGRHESGQ